MAETSEFDISCVRFERAPHTILRFAGMEVAAFRYGSGVEAVRITLPVGEVVVLPFKGQQIWDATFAGLRLTMRSMFDEPRATDDYLATYGALLIHCGISAIGGPGPEDSHPLHGELPNARFDTAMIRTGCDGEGPFLRLAGSCQQTRAFTYNYRFGSEITLRPSSSLIDVSVQVENLRQAPLEAMYLAHINFRPVDGGRLVDTVIDDRRGLSVRRSHPKGLPISEAHQRFVDTITADPAKHRMLSPGQAIDPEIVLFLNCAADANGVAHSLQVHPDGTADYVGHRPRDLPVGVRWICRSGDQEALGLLLPSTSGVEGFTAEKAAGRLVTLAAGGQFATRYRFGHLDVEEARRMIGSITALKG